MNKNPYVKPLLVKDLKKILSEYDDNAEVWVASDEEGNQYGAPTIEHGIGELEPRDLTNLDIEHTPIILYPVLQREC